MTVGAGGKLCYRAESRVGRPKIGKRCKTTRAYGLVAVHLSRVWLVHRSRAHVLRLQARRCSQLMLHPEAPFHEIRRVKLAIWNSRNRNWRETTLSTRLRRCAREQALRKSGSENLIRSHGCVDRAVRYTGRDCSAAHYRIAPRRSRCSHRAKQLLPETSCHTADWCRSNQPRSPAECR